jgi:hypothetical protein
MINNKVHNCPGCGAVTPDPEDENGNYLCEQCTEEVKEKRRDRKEARKLTALEELKYEKMR